MNKRVICISIVTGLLPPGLSEAASYGNGQIQYSNPSVPAIAGTTGREFIPEGYRDDAINSAISSAAAAGGGDVVLKAGVYLIGSKIQLRQGVNLVGKGIGATILKRTSSFAFRSVDEGATAIIEAIDQGLNTIVLKGFTIDGAWSKEELLDVKPNVSGIRITSSRNYYNDTITVDSVEVKNCGLGLLMGGVTNLTVQDCKFHHNGPYLLWHNLYLRRVGSVRIRNCEISDAHAGSGLKIIGGTRSFETESRDLIITGNKITNNWRNNCFITGFENVLVEDNEFNGQGETLDARLAGLYISDEPEGSPLPVPCSSFDIINNIFKDNAYSGLHVEKSTKFNVSGNYAASNTRADYNLHDNTEPWNCDYNADAPVPVIIAFSPADILPGETVTINGSGFAKVEDVLFSGMAAGPDGFSVVSPEMINATVPSSIPSTGRITVRTAFGHAESPDEFAVRQEPVIISQMADPIAMEGGRTSITAVATGHPAPVITWETSRDGHSWEEVEAGANYSISNDGKTLVLTATRDNADCLFRFRAANDAGGATSASVKLIVMADSFGCPTDAYVDARGDLYITDESWHVVHRITDVSSGTGVAGIFAGARGASGPTNGMGMAARFSGPSALAAHGNILYVADTLNNAIRAISTSGSTDTCSGFARPSGIAIDAGGTIYVADAETNVIRRIQAGGIIETIAGKTGQKGSDNGDGNLATFNNPTGLALDEDDAVLYIADTGNHLIREISLSHPGRTVRTLAGVTGSAGWRDGEADEPPLFKSPRGLAVAGGTLYVADSENHAVRAVDLTALSVSTVAGDPINTEAAELRDGSGAEARFYLPSGIALDAAENLYIADSGNGAIRHLDLRAGNRVDTLILNRLAPSGDASTLPPPGGDSNKSGGGVPTSGFLMALPALLLLRPAVRRAGCKSAGV
jgi:parallel beta-helix repeat protein